MTLTARVSAVLLIAFALAGCGQSGALYVPGDPSTVQEPPATEVPVEEGDDNSDDDEG